MGNDLCTCLTEHCDNSEDIIHQNTFETQKNSSTKVLYLNSQTSNINYLSLSHRQKLYLNSLNLKNEDTTTLNQFKQNTVTNTYIPMKTREDLLLTVPYIDFNTQTYYVENTKKINKIIAVYRGNKFRKKYSNEIFDCLINFEQKLIFKFNQKIKKENPNLEKCVNKYGELILDYQNSWKKYYDKKPFVFHGNNEYFIKEKKLARKIMKYNKNIEKNKYKTENYYKIDEKNKSELKPLSLDDKIDYLINNIKSFYEGETNILNNKIRSGFGILLKSNGEKKVGTWCQNKFEGWNYYIDINGNLYIGLFKNGQLNGKGEKHGLNSESYFGDFVNNLPEGKGKEINDSYIYEGHFKKGKKNGIGKIIYKDTGDWYEGNFYNNNFNGEGKYHWNKNGYEYKGNYVNGIIEGKGVYKYGDKAVYRGEFKNGVKEGKGEWITNNNKIVGNFENDLPHGRGFLEDNKGFKGYVMFEHGNIVGLNCIFDVFGVDVVVCFFSPT